MIFFSHHRSFENKLIWNFKLTYKAVCVDWLNCRTHSNTMVLKQTNNRRDVSLGRNTNTNNCVVVFVCGLFVWLRFIVLVCVAIWYAFVLASYTKYRRLLRKNEKKRCDESKQQTSRMPHRFNIHIMSDHNGKKTERKCLQQQIHCLCWIGKKH